MSRFVFALLALLGSLAAARAAEPASPVDSRTALFKKAAALFDDVQTKVLANGLKVYLKPIAGAPVVTIMVAYKVGAGDEELDQTGLSHYLEHLLFKGTDKLSPGDIDRLTQRGAGRNNAYTTEDMTVFHFDFAADRWTTALEIEADRMRNTRIDAKHEFQQEKGAVIAELHQYEDRPWDLEQKTMLPLLFGSKAPYGHPVIGERQHVEGATAEIIKRHYDRWYHPNNAALVIVGGFDEKEALARIEKLFGGIPKADLPERKPKVALPARPETVRVKFSSKFDTPRLLFGFNTVPSGAEDGYALDVLQSALAGGRTGRLYRKLIEQDKVASTVSASHSSGRFAGWLTIQVELLKPDLGKVEDLVSAELAKIGKDGITEAELQRIKRGMVAGYIFSNESIHGTADTIAQAVTTNDLAYLQGYLPKIAAVTANEVKRVAQQYLIDARGVVVWSIPRKPELKKTFAPPLSAARGLARSAQSAKPQAAETYALPNAKAVMLPNGLKLWLLENHRLPLVVAEAHVKQVRMREPAERNGVAELVGNLMQEGTTTRKGEEIARLIEDAGGALSVGSSSGSVKVLAPDTELGLDLLLDCLMNPSFPAEMFEARREEALSLIAEEERTPAARAAREFAALVYGKHPYGRPPLGTAAIVKKLTRQDCLDFHAAEFRPNNIVMAIVGDFDSGKVVDSIKQKTASWKPAEMPPLGKYDIELPAKFTQRVITDPDAAQVHVYLGQRGIKRDNPDYYKLLVMDNVLGTGPGFTDRLSATLRDRQGLAYTVSAQIAASAGTEAGAFTGYIGTFPDKFTWVRDGFLKEIRKLRDEPPTKREVDDAKQYLTGSLAFRTITSEQVASLLLTIDQYGLGLDYLDTYRKAVAAVTPEDVQAVAKKHLDPDRLYLVAVGAIDADGKPLGKKR